jgi:hypothetical protein
LAVADRYMDAKRVVEDVIGDDINAYDYSGSVWHRSQKL